ncbi:hypothetical protein CAPTEDRAFT_96116 [Capitella teleta]|uniref:CENP-V/GFA domain-containing protein n=1 Tax=Capitella teleta TaxID=283909 RepID=R7UHG7_CAPTE|nr:hypothetical protein CAPTEDRAFT_96116 [Capitella teleta]|eukprot:ELU02717.1 hypothetical protein CAPTEDRAFT_96116 [Capitella teleta]
MTEAAKKEVHGSCLCGEVAFHGKAQQNSFGVCHCSMCRKWSGGVMMALPLGDSLVFDKGEDLVTYYRSSPWGERAFCSACGTSLGWRMASSKAMVVSVMSLDEAADFSMDFQIFVDCNPGTYEFANETKMMTEAQFMESMQKNMPAS